MALTSQQINSEFFRYFGKNATQGELDYWSKKTPTELAKAVRNDARVKRVFEGFKKYRGREPKPEEMTKFLNSTPEQLQSILVNDPRNILGEGVTDKTPTPDDTVSDILENEPDEAELEKRAYHRYLLDYGIEIPELTDKYGLPRGYEPSKTQYGQLTKGYQDVKAISPQMLSDAMGRLNLDKKNILGQWQDIQAKIQSGQLDASDDRTQSLIRNLQDKTLAVQQTERGLSSRGTLFGGLRQRDTALASQPYLRQEQDIQEQYGRTTRDLAQTQSSGQREYDLAMQSYLGNKKSTQEQYGVQRAGATSPQFGVGTWNPATGQFGGVRFGAKPTDVKAGETFFGAQLYDALRQYEQNKLNLESEMRTGIGEEVRGSIPDYYQY